MVGGIAGSLNLKKKQYVAIKRGVLYQYETEKSREATERMQLKKMITCSVDRINENQFSILFKNFYLTIDCKDKWECQKWVNSIKLVKENIEEYVNTEDVLTAEQ